MLWRALCNVKHGFYVDVGAQDPVKDSVTKAFYERGWRGINLEPVQHYYELLIQHRPEDVNLQIAAGNKAGVQRFFEIPDTGLSTFSSKIAQRHVTQGLRTIERKVKVMPLSEILREHVKGAIHFLKI